MQDSELIRVLEEDIEGLKNLVKVPNDPLNTGICNKYKCKWCGFIGLKDSQGNLFR